MPLRVLLKITLTKHLTLSVVRVIDIIKIIIKKIIKRKEVNRNSKSRIKFIEEIKYYSQFTIHYSLKQKWLTKMMDT